MARLVMTMALAMTLVAAAGAVVLLVVTAFLALDGAGGPAPTPLLRTARATPRAAPPARARRAPPEKPVKMQKEPCWELARARHVAVVAVAEGVREAVPHEQRKELVGHDDDARGALGALARPREVDARERRRERG